MDAAISNPTALLHTETTLRHAGPKFLTGRRNGDLELENRRATNKCTPICSLPPELLARIFRLGQLLQSEELDDNDSYSERDGGQSFEVLVTHVNSYFRKTALGSPVLWSSIIITSSLSSAEMCTYLSRAQGVGLSVRIEVSSSILPLTTKNIETIIPYSNQYRQLVINSSSESSAQPIIHRFRGIAMPRLRYLSISVNAAEGILFPSTAFTEAPQLCVVRLRGLALTLFSPPLHNVTTLHLDQTKLIPILFSTFREMVTASSDLRDLSVYGEIIDTTMVKWPGLADPINIPTLRHLRICGVSGDVYSGLLLGIVAPSLVSIVLKGIRELDLLPFTAARHQSPQFLMLQDLVLIDPNLTVDNYTELFHAFPSVSSFTIHPGYETSPEILQLLSNPVIGSIPWTEFRTFSIVVDEDLDDVVAIVKRRLEIGYPLERVRLGTVEPLSTLSHFKWLDNNVTLESFISLGGWPEADARDPDDTLFE